MTVEKPVKWKRLKGLAGNAVKPRMSAHARSTAAFVIVVLVALAVVGYVVHEQGVTKDLSVSNKAAIVRLARDEGKLEKDEGKISRLQRQQAAQGKLHRRQIAASDLQLCTKLYGQIVQLEKNAAAQATVAIYHHLLPSIPLREIKALVANAQAGALKVEAQFDPKQCSTLPSQKFGATRATTTTTPQ